MFGENQRFGSSFWISLLLIGLGVAFLLDNFYIIDFDDLFEFWWIIFFFLAIKNGFGEDKSIYSAAIFFSLGLIFMFLYMDLLYWGEIVSFWPVILILVGLRLLFNRGKDGITVIAAYSDGSGFGDDEPGDGGRNDFSGNRLDAAAIFGGKEVRVTSPRFEGGNIVAIFGGVDVKFAEDCRLGPGITKLEIVAIFGGAEIHVPQDWHVVVKAMPIFGGVEDSRKQPPAADTPPVNVIELTGLALFGGIEIHSSPPGK